MGTVHRFLLRTFSPLSPMFTPSIPHSLSLVPCLAVCFYIFHSIPVVRTLYYCHYNIVAGVCVLLTRRMRRIDCRRFGPNAPRGRINFVDNSGGSRRRFRRRRRRRPNRPDPSASSRFLYRLRKKKSKTKIVYCVSALNGYNLPNGDNAAGQYYVIVCVFGTG